MRARPSSARTLCTAWSQKFAWMAPRTRARCSSFSGTIIAARLAPRISAPRRTCACWQQACGLPAASPSPLSLLLQSVDHGLWRQERKPVQAIACAGKQQPVANRKADLHLARKMSHLAVHPCSRCQAGQAAIVLLQLCAAAAVALCGAWPPEQPGWLRLPPCASSLLVFSATGRMSVSCVLCEVV